MAVGVEKECKQRRQQLQRLSALMASWMGAAGRAEAQGRGDGGGVGEDGWQRGILPSAGITLST